MSQQAGLLQQLAGRHHRLEVRIGRAEGLPRGDAVSRGLEPHVADQLHTGALRHTVDGVLTCGLLAMAENLTSVASHLQKVGLRCGGWARCVFA